MAATDPQKAPTPTEVDPGVNLREWFHDFMDLRTGSDRTGAVQSIISGKQMRGSNAWMLVCSIMIASLGLNLNSGAVIIGAMLISPLMNPILGVGLGIGTNDREMLWQSLKNFGVAIIIALVTSVVYFALTPIDVFTDQMESRTEPTILDALVAVFGGLAGIISVTRLDKTNAIPGVAIATALMPPLCVSGYGIVLAFSNWELGLSYFWRAFYLFFLNSFFIAVTAYAIIRLLGFPYRKYVNQKEKRRSQIIIGIVSFLMILPGAYVLKGVLQKLGEERSAEAFTKQYFPDSKTSFILNREERDKPVLIYPIENRTLAKDSLEYFEHILQDSFGLANARIVMDTTAAAMEAGIQGNQSRMNSQNNRINLLEQRHQELLTTLSELRSKLLSSSTDAEQSQERAKRLKLAFPNVEVVYFGKSAMQFDSLAPIPLVGVKRSWPGRRPPVSQLRAERVRLQEYLKSEMSADSVILIVEDR